mmetsp:Transcript_22202/g.42144  ORF Transcript_22202/g.42144 Transcript_22202/m.42144 type:complete len:208 (+) Transcript_22202:959-1582(+)
MSKSPLTMKETAWSTVLPTFRPVRRSLFPWEIPPTRRRSLPSTDSCPTTVPPSFARPFIWNPKSKSWDTISTTWSSKRRVEKSHPRCGISSSTRFCKTMTPTRPNSSLWPAKPTTKNPSRVPTPNISPTRWMRSSNTWEASCTTWNNSPTRPNRTICERTPASPSLSRTTRWSVIPSSKHVTFWKTWDKKKICNNNNTMTTMKTIIM